MTLPRDLLDQAGRLLTHETKKPKQAILRRAISTAYYALFHLLGSEAGKRMAPSEPKNIEFQMQRALEHGTMKRTCQSFAGGTLPLPLQHLVTGTIEPELRMVAKDFVDLQEARHPADYDLIHTFTKQEANDRVEKAKEAFSNWASVRKSPNAALFLVALALPKMYEKRG